MKKRQNRGHVAALILGFLVGGLPAYAATAGNYNGHQAIAGDFNGDGWTDLILQPTAGNQGVAELIAYPDGNFGQPLATWKNKSGGTDWNADAHRLVVGDFNGDGRDDVLLQGAAGLPSQIAFSLPDGSVEKSDYVIPGPLGGLDVSQANHHIVVGDFNGDGRDDILLQANTFVGTNAVALATPNGHFTSLAAKWQDGFKGLSWSLDHTSIVAGDFSGDGRDELLLRSNSASGATKCCELMTLGSDLRPDQMKQQWSANYLGVDWDPSTHLAIVGDFNGDGRDDVLLQPMAAGGELDVVLSNAAGHLAILSDKWNSERNGIDWSAQSYMLVPENGGAGKGSTLLMVPKQAGLPYRRASFDSQGRLVSVKTIKAPPDNIFSGASSLGSGGTIPGGTGLHAMALATTNTVTNANMVGTMNGQPSANNGAAGYSINIAVPPGRAGMQPSLSLSYSSTGGDGQEGVGWSLGGLSSIYRCPATWATDGHTAGTTFTSSDDFCLDGQKLILTSGTYGADGSIYHTEINGFSKIVAHGQLGGGPGYFTVQTPNGRTLTYGGTAVGTLVNNANSNGTVFSWALTGTADLYGNKVSYNYGNNLSAGGVGAELWPTQITYTLGNGDPGTNRIVKFQWENRSAIGADTIVHYLSGMKQQTSKLLTDVTTWVGGTEVRDYHLAYTKSQATGRPLLQSVQVCAYVSGSPNCFEPTTFSYQGQQAPTFAPVTGTSLGLVDPGTYSLCQRSKYGEDWVPLDFNGDGRLDLLSSIVQGSSSQMEVQYGQESNVFTAPSTISIAPPESSATNLNLNNPIDFDLDGLSDFTFNINTSSNYYLEHDTAQPGSTPTYAQLDSGVPAPVNGSGISGEPFASPLIGDVNGDGRSDLFLGSYPASGQTLIQVYQGQDPATHTYPFTKGASVAIGAKIDSAQPFDYNADGRTDLLIRYDQASDYRLLLSNNGAFSTNVQTNIPVVNSPDTGKVPVFIADVNGDSLPDIIEAEQNSSGVWDWFVYINTGASDGVFQVEDTGISARVADGSSTENIAVGQLRTMRDPDGRTDLVVPVARTFVAPELAPYACSVDGGGCPLSWPQGSNSFCKNLRTDSWPSNNDGYNWKVYRSTGPGDAPNFVALSFTANNLKASEHLVLDDNADGLPDLVGVYPRTPTDSTEQPRTNLIEGYQLSYGTGDPMPDLLHQVTNGLDVQTTWTYKPLSDTSVGTRTGTSSYPNMLFKSPMQVVATFSQSNPIGGTNTDTYSYENPKYNVAGRGFSGFNQITVNNEARGLTTTTTYDQTFPLTGRVVRSATSLTGNSTPFSVTTHDWQSLSYTGTLTKRYVVKDHESIDTQSDPTSTAPPQVSATGGYTLISQSVTTQTVDKSNVDLCGNVSASSETITTQQASVTLDNSATYATPGSVDTCWEDVANSASVTKGVNYGALAANSTPAVGDSVSTTTAYTYNSEYSVKTKTVTSSHNISAERYVAYGYDAFGNRDSVTLKDIAAGTSRTTTINFGTDGYFPVSVTKAAQQISIAKETTTATYDAATGNKTEVVDPNGDWTTYAYDPFGRKLGGQVEGQSSVQGDYYDPTKTTLSCPTLSAYVLEKQQAGYPTTYTCFDAFGNALRTATAAFSTGSWVTVDSTYNDLGELTIKTTPYYPSMGPAPYKNNYSYDVLERLKSKTVPTETGTGTRTIAMSYSGLTLAYTDTDNSTGVTHYYTRYYDGLGKGNGHLVEVQQEKKDSTWVTSTYRYNADGDLVRTTDSAGNAITASYDGFGDKLTLNDPDQGASSYTYDGYGEQVSSKNGRGQTITTTYDVLGRPTQVSDQADNRVTNTTYDNGPKAVGKPVTETVTKNGAVVYTRQYGYDEDGRPIATDITTGGASYVQGVAYDSYGRPAQQAYPALSGGASTSGPTVSASVSPTGPVNLNSTVTLNAAASDPNGNWSLTYQWKQTAGPSASIATDDAQTTDVTLTTAGTYTFQVTAYDGFTTSTSSVSIVVEPPPSATETPTSSTGTSYNGSYTLSWGSISGATTYQLQESLNGGSWTAVYNGTALSASLSGRAIGSYSYQVRGCNPVGCAPWGGTVTVTVEAPTGTVTPTSSTGTSYSGSYSVSWSSVTGASSYQLQESFNSGAWTTVQNSGATSWSASGKGAGSYAYRVRPCSAVGCGTWGGTVSVTVEAPTGTVTPSVSPNPSVDGSYTVSWSSVTGASTYQLQESANGGTWTTVQNSGATSWSASGKAAGSYAYRVTPCSAVGCGSTGGTVTEQVNPPPAGGATTLSPNPSYTGSYTVSWASVTRATSYQLDQSLNSGAWSTVYNGGNLSWSASGNVVGSYRYRVRGCDSVGCGNWGSIGTETVSAPPAPGTPALSPNPSRNGTYTVSWGAETGASTYQLQESANGGAWTTKQNTSAQGWSTSGRGSGTYQYRVRTCNSVTGCGSWSGTASETVSAPLPPGTPAVSPNPSANGSYTVSWGTASYASTYQLQESANGGAWTTKQNTSSRSWSTSGRGNGTYQYRVRTCNSVTGCGGWSGTVTETVYLPPGAPSLSPSTKTVTTGNNYTISWTLPSGVVTEFQLEVDTGSNTFTNSTPQNVGMAQSETYTAPATSVEKDIYYRVRACNHSTCGAWSNNSHIFDMPASGGGCQLCSPVVSPSSARKTAASTPTKTSMTTATTTTSTTTTNYSGGTGAIVVNTTYNADGYPVSLTRQSDGYVYMQVASMDVWGHATMVYEGGASASSATVTVTRVDDPATGLVTSLTAANASTNATLASFTSAWDGFGNLTQRTAGGSTETATYDALNRLTGSTTTLTGGGGTVTDSYTYSDIGNRTQACSDTSCTAFTYGTNGAGPHAVSAVNAITTGYAYDPDGEMTQDNNRTLTWSAFGKAMSIAQGSTTLNFSYGPGGSRYKKVVTGPASETVTYLGGAEVLNVNGSTSIRRTLGFAGLTVIDIGGTNAGVHFAIPDHLGSTMALIAGDGTVTQGLSYGDFGKRYTSGWNGTSPSGGWLSLNTSLTDKGYTGQESLDSVGLDDYNARLYDPNLGRFLSTDPLIGHPGSTQSINPYSYVENNPLNKTDPTGEASTCTPSADGKTLSCTVTVPVSQTGSHIQSSATVSYTQNASTGKISNVSTSGPASMPGSGIAFTTDGNSSVTVSAGSGQGQQTTPANDRTDPNQHNYTGQMPASTGNSSTSGQREKFQKNLGALEKSGKLSSSHHYKTRDKAAIAVLRVVAPLSHKYGYEVAGNIYHDKSGWHYTLPRIGGPTSSSPYPLWAGYHTHPYGGLTFSDVLDSANEHWSSLANDAVWVFRTKQALYLGVELPNGDVGVAVCKPGACPTTQPGGDTGKVIQQ